MTDPTGIELIAAERQRQIESEGWTAKHDDSHAESEMVHAAMCYADVAVYGIHNAPRVDAPENWPWDAEWWRPSYDSIRNLVKAGALIAAEIDRLKRVAKAEREKEDQALANDVARMLEDKKLAFSDGDTRS